MHIVFVDLFHSLRLSLFLFILTVGLLGCNGCSQQTAPPEQTIQRYLPKSHYGFVLLPLLSDLPTRLNQLLVRFEGSQKPGQAPTGQLRHYLQEFRDALGVDILNPQSFEQHGIQANSMLLAMRVRMSEHKGIVIAIPTTHPSRLETLLKTLAEHRFVARHIEKQSSEKGEIVTIYRKRQNTLSEELTYGFVGKVGFIVRPIIRTPGVQKTSHGYQILKAMYDLPAEQSLGQDPTFSKVVQRWQGKAQAVLHMPARPTKSMKTTAVGKPAQMGSQPSPAKASIPTTRPSSQTARPLATNESRDVPLLQSILGRLRQNNPFSEATTALSVGGEGLQMDTHLPLSAARIRRLQRAVPPTGEPQRLLRLLNQRAILGFKLSLNPQELPSLVARTISTSAAQITPMQLYTALQTHTGLDLKKDLLPVLSGHAMLALYHVYPQVYQRFQSSAMLLPSTLELAVVAELRDPKRAQILLDKMAGILQIGGGKVQTVPTADQRKEYKIMAWPHAMAYWTIVDRYFIYSLGRTPIKLAIQALQNPSYRLYSKQAPESLTAQASNTLFLHLPNLVQAFNALYIPMALKMTVTSFYLLNLKNIQMLSLSYQPGEEEMNLQARIQLAPASSSTPNSPKTKPQPKQPK